MQWLSDDIILTNKDIENKTYMFNFWVRFCKTQLFKGVLHLIPKISMFCDLSQNNQQLFEK